MPAYIQESEIINKTYGKWVALREGPRRSTPKGKYGIRQFWCRCSCGYEGYVGIDLLRLGRSKSCGYCTQYLPKRPQSWHGFTKLPEYRIWQEMLRRCFNPKRNSYKDYGGRGITVCVEWRTDFPKFLADLGPRPSEEYSLNRKDNDGHYCLDNCEWTTDVEQARNKRTNTIYVFNGVGRTLPEWAEHIGVRAETMRTRIEVYGWSVERALTEPVHESFRHKSKAT